MGPNPVYHVPVFGCSRTTPRPSLVMEGGTVFHFVLRASRLALERACDAAGELNVRAAVVPPPSDSTCRPNLSTRCTWPFHPPCWAPASAAGRLTDQLGYRCEAFVPGERLVPI